MPRRELERRRRVAALEGARLSDLHPLTAARIEALEARPFAEPLIALDTATEARLAAELSALASPLQRQLLGEHRASLYR